MGRSTVYAARDREESDGPAGLKKRGPKTKLSDEELVEEIRQVLKESDFLGEGHRKVRARLRAKGIGVGKNRVLRLMRENGLLAPVRRGKHPRGDRSHSGRITRRMCRTSCGVRTRRGSTRRRMGGAGSSWRWITASQTWWAGTWRRRAIGGQRSSRSARVYEPTWTATRPRSLWGSAYGTTGALSTPPRSSPELCVKVRGSSSMLRLGCLGDLLGFEKREIEVAAFAPDRSSLQSNRGDEAERTGSVGEGAGAPDPTLDLGVQALEAVRGA